MPLEGHLPSFPSLAAGCGLPIKSSPIFPRMPPDNRQHLFENVVLYRLHIISICVNRCSVYAPKMLRRCLLYIIDRFVFTSLFDFDVIRMYLPVLQGGHSINLLERFDEVAGVCISHLIGNFFYRHFAV